MTHGAIKSCVLTHRPSTWSRLRRTCVLTHRSSTWSRLRHRVPRTRKNRSLESSSSFSFPGWNSVDPLGCTGYLDEDCWSAATGRGDQITGVPVIWTKIAGRGYRSGRSNNGGYRSADQISRWDPRRHRSGRFAGRQLQVGRSNKSVGPAGVSCIRW